MRPAGRRWRAPAAPGCWSTSPRTRSRARLSTPTSRPRPRPPRRLPELDRRTAVHDVAPGSVGVWLGWLEPPAATLARLRALLDADELARAARFVFERDRRRFVAAHGFARLVLGGYLGLDGARLRFGYGP